jgi:RNase P/RNase MRP subunit POP5
MQFHICRGSSFDFVDSVSFLFIQKVKFERSILAVSKIMVRLKFRYFVIEMKLNDANSTYAPEANDIMTGIIGPFTARYGIWGAGSCLTSVRMIVWNRESRIGVFRVPRKWDLFAREFFGSIDNFNAIALRIVVHHVAGTIDQAQKWMRANCFELS